MDGWHNKDALRVALTDWELWQATKDSNPLHDGAVQAQRR
jgi:hypothetical protein